MSLKDQFRQDLPNEEELIGTDRRISSELKDGAVSSQCPTKAQWIFFVAGRFNEARAAALAEHLAECETCTAMLAEIRSKQKTAQRRSYRSRLILAAVAAVVVIAALSAMLLWRSRFPSETVTADLRNVTRGADNSQDSGVTLHRNTGQLRILLPSQAVEGPYEVAIFNPADQTSPVLTLRASSTQKGDSLVLEAPLVVSGLQRGPYLLGIRHNGLRWAYYAIRIE